MNPTDATGSHPDHTTSPRPRRTRLTTAAARALPWPLAALATLALASCGATHSTETRAATPPPTAAVIAAKRAGKAKRNAARTASARPHATAKARYRIMLRSSGESPPGAQHATAAATLTVYGTHEICWKIDPTPSLGASIAPNIDEVVTPRTILSILPLPTTHKGCQPGLPSKLIDRIEHQPNQFYLNIQTGRYPRGAIRAAL
jgi:hypothetical protein